LVFLFIFELGSLICGLANSSAMLIVGRAIAGSGGAGLMNGSMTIITASAPLEKRPLYIGLMMGLGFTGIAIGPLVGGALTEHVTWRWCFYINLPVGGVAALCLFLINIPDITPKEAATMAMIRKVIPELDLFGFVLFVPAIIMFLLALQFGSDESFAWNSPTIIGLFVGAGVEAIVFIAWEYRRGPRAMVPGAIIKQTVVWSSSAQNFCLMAALVTASNYMPMYFQAIRGVGPLESGVDVLPSILSQLAGAVGSGVAGMLFDDCNN
jgi:MFS family permease